MHIELTKLTNDRHRLDVVRDDGTRDGAELETRSFLLHDLVHYAVEAEADIADGFWGSLAAGRTLESLSDRDAPYAPGGGLALAETLTGPMQSLWNGRLDDATYVELLRDAAPAIVDDTFVARAHERLRRLMGRWKATPFRVPMVLAWPAAQPQP